MAGAQGKTTRWFQFGVAEDSPLSRVDGQDRGTAGIVISPRGDVRRMGGISPVVAWTGAGAPSSPFKSSGCFALGAHRWGGVTDLLLSYNGKVAVLRGTTLDDIITGHVVPSRARDAHRFAQVAGNVFITNGRDANQKWDGRILSPVGVHVAPPAPNVLPIEELATAEGLFSAGRSNVDDEAQTSYKTTYVSLYGQESEPSPASPTLIASPTAAADSDGPFVGGAAASKYVVLVDVETDEAEGFVVGQDDVVDRNLWRSVNKGPYTFAMRLSGVTGHAFYDDVPMDVVSTVLLAADGENAPPPVALWCFPYRSRVYYLGLDLPSFLRYSRSNAPEAVPATNLLDVSSTDGDVVTGYAIARDYVAVFKGRSVHLLTHDKDENPILTPISQGIGAVSDRAIVSRDGIVYFMGHGGLYRFDGSSVESLGEAVRQRILRLPRAHLPDAIMWLDPVEPTIYLSVNPSSSDGVLPAEVWAVNTGTGFISVGTKFNVGAAATIGEETFVAFFADIATKREWDLGLWGAKTFAVRFGAAVGTGAEYPSSVSSDWLDLGTPAAQKRWLRLDLVYVQTGDVDLKLAWNVDWDDREDYKAVTFKGADPDATIWGEGSWGDAGKVWDRARVRTVRVDLEDTTSFAIRFRAEVTTEKHYDFRILGFYLTYADHGLRQVGTDNP